MTPSDLSLYHWDTGRQLNPKHYFLAASTNTVTIKRTSNASSARGRSCWKLVCRYLLPSNTGYGKTWCRTWFCRGKKKLNNGRNVRSLQVLQKKKKGMEGGRKERDRDRGERKGVKYASRWLPEWSGLLSFTLTPTQHVPSKVDPTLSSMKITS